MRNTILLLIIIPALTGCILERCMVEEHTYSCQDFQRNQVILNDDNITFTEVQYRSDGLLIKGIIAEPKGPGPYPMILFNHGGRHGIKELNWLETLADQDYIVVASQFRGENTSEGEIEVALGETTDVMNLHQCAKQELNIDKENMGIMGFSHGGGITLQILTFTDEFKSAMSYWGASDILGRFKNIKSTDDPLYNWTVGVSRPQQKLQLMNSLLARSPIHCMNKVNTPLTIIHGTTDDLIPYEYAIDLTKKLDKHDKTYDLITYEGIGHEFDRDGQKDLVLEEEALRMTIDHFDAILKE